MIRAEYQRFIGTLGSDASNADVRKLANLVLQHLDTLLPLSNRYGGTRVIHVFTFTPRGVLLHVNHAATSQSGKAGR